MAPDMAGDIAHRQDFALPLALAADDYAALRQCVLTTHDAARQFHRQWLATGDPASRAAAQGLHIKGTLLHGLHTMRLHHKEWLSSTPVASPQTLAHVLPHFRHALDLCEKASDAVQFPIQGLDPALVYLQQQVEASRQSLENGQWQITPEGRWQAERYAAQHAQAWPPQRAAAHPADTSSASDPFAGVKAVCRDLGEVLQQLRATLAYGPASRQAGPVASTGEAPHTPAPSLERDRPVPPVAEPAAATPLQAWERSFKSVLVAGLAAPRVTGTAARSTEAPPRHQSRAANLASSRPRQAAGPPVWRDAAAPSPRPATAGTSAHVVTVAAECPVDEAAEVARQRQERITALQTALAPLRNEAARLRCAAQDCARDNTTGGPLWASHSRSFSAWQAAAQAHDQWDEALATHAPTLSDAGSSDPVARRLQDEVDTASHQVLDQAAQAARLTLAAFSQDCHAVLTQEQAHVEGQASPADLAAQCRHLQKQWMDAPLRPRLPEIEAEMAQYSAFEAALSVKVNEPQHPADALHRAEQLRQAADQKLYAQLRNVLLCKAVDMEVEAIVVANVTMGEDLLPGLNARAEAALAFDLLLIGDPLPDERDEAGGALESQPVPAQASQGKPEGDPVLVQQASLIAETAYALREQSLELPADAPQQAARELQAAQAVLHQLRLTAQTTAAALGGIHELAAALNNTNPTQWPALARRRANDLKQLTDDLSLALQTQQKLARQRLSPRMQALLANSSLMLRMDRPLAARAQLVLETLGSLLALRVSANQTRRRFEQDKLNSLVSTDVLKDAHFEVAQALEKGKRAIEDLLREDAANVTAEAAWACEAVDLQQSVLALECRINCDRALIQGKLLLKWAAKALEPDSVHLRTRDSVSTLMQVVLLPSGDLARLNQGALKFAADRSNFGDRYRAQIDINRGVQRKLLELHRVLQQKLNQMPPEGAAGSGTSRGG